MDYRTPPLSLFIAEFVQVITAKFPGKIRHILLAGSAVRGDFILGKSDIDLIISVNDPTLVKGAQDFAAETFWSLDKKYSMAQKSVFSRKSAERLVPSHDKFPVTVFFPRKQRFWHYFDLFYKTLIRPGRANGLIVFQTGEYTRSKIYDDPLSLLITYHLLISILSVLLFVFSPERSLNRSVRLVQFTFEGPRQAEWEKKALQEARLAKENPGSLAYLEKAAFCIKSPFLIARSNLSDLVTKTRTGKLPEDL
jgi:predicted nucleotidyltransferase